MTEQARPGWTPALVIAAASQQFDLSPEEICRRYLIPAARTLIRENPDIVTQAQKRLVELDREKLIG